MLGPAEALPRPDPLAARGERQRAAGQPGLHDLAALVVADEALAGRLAALADRPAFVNETVRCATMHGVTLAEDSLRTAVEPDPLGLDRWSPPALCGATLPPRHWLPAAVIAAEEGIAVDWAWFGGKPVREPFYEETLRFALNLPFNRVFRYRTGLADLVAQADALDSLGPDGFIFHMSRCGSTLVAQMLAALDHSIVISEAPPVDAVVQLIRNLAEADAARALRAIVLAFGRRRAGAERRYVVKLDAWHTLALPAFRRAFPDVPWLFLYRDPVEVLVSQLRQRGMQTVPNFFPPGFYGIADADCTLDEAYCARVLAALCRPVFDRGIAGSGLILNYRQLPDAVFTAVLPHFGIACSDAEQQRMRQVALSDAKAPGLPFAGDAKAKQRAATDAIRRAAACHLGEIYARLEALAGIAAIN